MVLADQLSKFPSWKENLSRELHQQIQHIKFSNDRLNIIRGAIKPNPFNNTLYLLILNGWPKCLHQLPGIAQHCSGMRDELSVENCLLIKGNRVCILPGLYDRTLTDFYASHQGITKCSKYWEQLSTSRDATYALNTMQVRYYNQCYPKTSPTAHGKI